MVDSDVGSKRHSEKIDVGLHIMSPIHSLCFLVADFILFTELETQIVDVLV